jgi:hypothetical protein
MAWGILTAAHFGAKMITICPKPSIALWADTLAQRFGLVPVTSVSPHLQTKAASPDCP